MKKVMIVSICFCCVFMQQAMACTTFFINKDGQLVFGRNYDWLTDAGMVCSNLIGLEKTSVMVEKGANTITWISKYGSITFNQYGKELPTGGMNEKGLVVELMWADGSKYPAADSRPALHILQWIQYQLDNNARIEEVIATDEKIRISLSNPPCHFLIADSSGNAATIEFLEGKMVVHKGNDLPFAVLTNSTYTESAKTASSANVLSGNTNFSFQDNSLQRFTRACSMVQQFQQNKTDKPIIDYAFDILNSVAVKDFTKWSIVYDLKNKKIFFKTAGYQSVKFISFNSFDFSCTAKPMALNMNQSLKEDPIKDFQPLSSVITREIMQKAINESKGQVPIGDEAIDANIAYVNSIKCKDR